MSHESSVAAERRRHEIRVGAFVIAGVILAFILVFSITDPALLRGRYHLTLKVPNAQGLRGGDTVQMRGVNIGRVRGFWIEKQSVSIDLEIEGGYHIPKDSKAQLRSTNLLGESIVDIQPGSSPEDLKNGETLAGEGTESVFGRVDSVAEEASSTLDRVNELLSPELSENLQTSSAELSTLLKKLIVLSDELRRLSVGLRDTNDRPELQESITQLAIASESLAVISRRIERGEGTLGRLSQDETLYTNMNAAAVALQKLLTDVQKNPKRYFDISVF